MSYFLIIIVAAISVILTILIIMFTRRRHTPAYDFDQDAFPTIESILPTITGLTQSSMYEGNDGAVLQDDELFPAIFKDIEAARHSIHLETFVWTAGKTEKRMIDALSARAREGIEVRVIIDAIGGSKADSANLDKLRQSGVEVCIYCKPRLWNWRRFNQRTHRKLLIIDGRIGYTFGHGIADYWAGVEEKQCRDTGIRLQGPVVHALQGAFVENWMEETHCLIAGDGCFPELHPVGNSKAHVVTSASSDVLSKVSLLYRIAIISARREILIQNPYFAPDKDIVELLAQAVKRGVKVSLMIPGQHADHQIVRRAGCHLFEPLLRAGIKIYEYKPTLLHQKIMIVDDIWSHIGSTNFDARSLELNEEISMGLIDSDIAAELKNAFQKDCLDCDELALENWVQRPRYQQFMDLISYQLHDQL